jgi:hypothetical protein
MGMRGTIPLETHINQIEILSVFWRSIELVAMRYYLSLFSRLVVIINNIVLSVLARRPAAAAASAVSAAAEAKEAEICRTVSLSRR